MFYSATTQGFYSPEIHRSMPSDAVLLTAQEYADLMEGQASGKRISPVNGRPVLTDHPAGPSVPAVVSKFQAKAALLQAGLLEQTESLMAQADAVARLAWDNAQEFRRNSPTVLAMGAALGLDAAALDQLFITAAGIEA